MTQKIKTGDIWLANLNHNKGAEPGKIRPVLILQNQDLLSIGHSTTVIVPLTTNILAEDLYPLRIRVHAQDHLKKDSDLLMSQIRAIDNVRLIQGPLTKVTHKQLQTIYAAVREVMGMDN